ncbi:MAG: InlB B-repeat-containing protein [Prevotella sp.]|nr:InlB B-repeat-containing protein [Prevotella sp.]
MKKLLTLLTLLVVSLTGAWADTTFKCKLNGSVVQERNDGNTGDFFTFSFSSGSYSWKSASDVAGCTYDGVDYTQALKFDSKPTLSFTTTQKATVIVVQSTSKNSNKAPKLDNTAMTTSESITGANVWTATDVAAGTHTVKYNSEIWIHCVYVIYSATTYNITLDDNGDYQGNGSAKVTANGTSLTDITAPKRTGYSVSGYYAEAGCTTQIAEANGTLLANKTGFTDADGKWTATENKTLYAAWEAGKYTLTIEPNEAGWGTVSPTSVANIPYNTATSSSSNTFTVNGTTVTATPSDATAEYTYAFSEWTDLPATVTDDVTVTATFTRTPKSYTLAWDGNGDGATLSGEYTNGSTPFGTTIVKPTATRTGYVLAGWATTADGEVVEVTTMPAANTTYYAKWTEAVAPTVSAVASLKSNTTSNAATFSIPQNVSARLTATATGTPAPTITWYQSATAVASGGTEKGTGATYDPAVSTVGTYYFYAVASNGVDPDATSGVVTLTVAPKLNSLVYSNGFKAFIQQPAKGHGTIKAYFLAGTDAPTISSFTATEGATYSVEDNTLTLTAADGATTAIFDITLAPVSPYSGKGEYTFTSNDTWVKAGNGFSSGWKIARSYESDSEEKFMVSTGTNRLYLFLAPSTSFTVTQSGTTRDMLVSINGGDAIEKKAADTFTVNGDEDAAYMVEIAQKNSNGGDGKISNVTITKTGFESGIITEAGWNSFSSTSKLDLSTITGGAAYVATTTDNDNITLTATSAKVNAGEGLMIQGTPNAAFTISTTTDDATLTRDNLLVGLPNGGTVTANDNNYVFAWQTADVSTAGFYFVNDAEPTLGAGKAYLHTNGGGGAKLNIIVEEGETDGIGSIENGKLKIETSVYNLAGQKVDAAYKGIVIVNGKKYVRK